VNVIPAVEIETDTGEILGYFVNHKDKNLIKMIQDHAKRNEGKVKDWCRKLSREGYKVSLEEIKRKFPAKGRINSFYPLYLLYLKGYGAPLSLVPKLRKNKNLKPIDIKMIPTIQAIRAVKKAGGAPVLAHPWVDDLEHNFKMMGKFVKAGLVGIEANNGDRAPFKKKSVEKQIRTIARKYNLLLTSGSDYHGEDLVKLMPGDHRLGHNNCDENVVKLLKIRSGVR